MNELLSVQSEANLAGFVQAVFAKQQDRWFHRIEWVTSERIVTVGTSIEGTSREHWPASPPFQEVTRQVVDDDILLLGVGMAGRSHWSFSCSSQAGKNGPKNSLLMDMACLAKDSPVGALGSSYQLDPAWGVKTGDQQRLTLVDGEDETIEFVALDGPGWASELLLVEDQFKVIPTRISNSPVTPTRWAFAVEVRNNRA